MNISLEGKSVIVTGASRGIGRAVAIGFAKAGANLVLNSRSDSAEMEETQKLIAENSNSKSVAVFGSVADKEVAETLSKTAVSEFGSLDVLINNAGVVRDKPLMLMRDSDWSDVVDTNLTGVFECTRAAARPMMQQRSGRIISISSISAISGRTCAAWKPAACCCRTRNRPGKRHLNPERLPIPRGHSAS